MLRDLLARPETRAAMGEAGERRARSRYGWPRVAERTEAVYLDVIAGQATPTRTGSPPRQEAEPCTHTCPA
nr:hypothetical protein GCM10020093_005390 [Planobispora longispora]